MIYYASWQHKLKTYIHKITAGNDYKKKQIGPYSHTHEFTQNYKHSAKLLHTADLMLLTVYIVNSCQCSKFTVT